MKKITFQVLTAALVSLTVLFAACSKEGPVGPAGEQGPAGLTGAQGPAGPKGDAGTANVIYSDWQDVEFDNGIGAIYAPGLSTDMLNSGVIKVYWNMSNSTDPFVVSVPCTVPAGILFDGVQDSDPPIFIDTYFQQDSIFLVANYDVSSVGGFSQFRYILIPGGSQIASKSANIDWKNYAEVRKRLNLKD